MDYAKAVDDILSCERNQSDDYYFVLGCDESSSEEQISAEYKARVLYCHPDKHPADKDAHEKFALLSKAKDVLLDPEKRKDYDKWRNSGLALTYDRWRSMSHVKTSMHWGVHKPQTAISHSSHGSEVNDMTTDLTDTRESGNLQLLKEKMKFTRREDTNPTRSQSGWERDTSNPMLEKFRNYQI